MITEALTLFDELPQSPAVTVPCMWHSESEQESTHRVALAVDLMNPHWWQSGGILPDGGLRAAGGGCVRLYTIGAGYCDACVARDAGAGLSRGKVRHFIPLPGEAS